MSKRAQFLEVDHMICHYNSYSECPEYITCVCLFFQPSFYSTGFHEIDLLFDLQCSPLGMLVFDWIVYLMT